MSFRPLKVTFHLDGAGLYYDPAEPVMLDSLLCAAMCRWHVSGEPPGRDEPVKDIPLPLQKWRHQSGWGWHASALFPEGPVAETTRFWRKRLRHDHIELTKGSPNVTNGTYRDWNMPVPLLLVHRMIAFCCGDRRLIKRALSRDVKFLGKKRAHGYGRIVEVSVEEIESDFSLELEGKPTRWLPDPQGSRLVRLRPPYWSNWERVTCSEIYPFRFP